VAAQLTRPRPFVIKIGGSLAADSSLAEWLSAIEKVAGQPIIVPGGGAFADAVRQAQKDMGFDDLAAHRMALLAMEQYGLALAARAEDLILASTPAAIQRVWRLGKIPVWAPAHMLAAATPVQPSWDATSDSLSAWLAGELRATRLLLIKSADIPAGGLTLLDLAASGIVDSLFPGFAGTSGAEIYVAGPSALANAAAIFANGGVPGTRILLS
jgi:dihydroneopterin aldolase